ncbi:unnamed protein product [Closterium sp. NIES-64]|nr:unnamed protein product [Closterium sp. NIES-64]
MAASEAVDEGPDEEDDAGVRPASDPLTGLDFLRSLLPKHNPQQPKPSQPSSIRPSIPVASAALHEAIAKPATAAQQAVRQDSSVEAPSRPAPPTNLRFRQSTIAWATPPPSSTTKTPTSDASPMQDNSKPTQASSKPKADTPELKYEEAHARYKSKWSTDFSWLVLTQTSTGAPSFKCSICLEFSGLNGKCGRHTEGATDVQTQSFKKHEGTVKHRFALQRQEDLLQKYGCQQRINMHPKAQDLEMRQVSSLLDYAQVHTQIVRTTSILESGYVDCGDEFGGGPTERLNRFIEKHGPRGSPEMVIEGASSDDSLNRFKVTLHERTNPNHRGPGHHDACVALCTDMAEHVVKDLQSKLGDLESLS